MKEKFIRWSKPLLTASMALGIWVTVGITSLVLFGEYEYPTEK